VTVPKGLEATGDREAWSMHTLRWIGIAAVVALVLSTAPVALGAHHVGPPDETGMGAGDVSDEPNTGPDQDLSSNGLVPCEPSCTEDTGTLVLDGIYSAGAYPYFVDLNNVLRETSAEAPGLEHEDRMYPGQGFLSAWWGWWADKGRGDGLHETGQTVPGLVSDEPDGVVNDGHDDHQGNDDGPYTGAWDEFVWRGENPWAGQSDWDPQLGGKPRHDGGDGPGHADKDAMYAFVEPGTHDNADWAGLEGGEARVGLLTNDADGAKKPDLRMSDRTNQAPSSPGPYPHNGAGYGWLSEFGYWHYQYDKSLIVASTVAWSVDPDPAGTQSGAYQVHTGDKVDVDAYSALHPELERLYRQTVWDPGNEEDGPADALHPEGPKELVKETYHQSDLLVAQISDVLNEAVAPANPAVGAADDAAEKPWPKEPTTADDTHPADHDDHDSYGALAGSSDAYYENPDATQDYAPYADGFAPWIDSKTKVASLQYAGILRLDNSHNAFPTPVADNGERTAPPGLLFVTANLGAWWDVDDDLWIGDLDETGRTTDPGSPYADGRVDDPNDYTDTPSNTEASALKSPPAEFLGAGQKTTISATLRPVCEPSETNADGECPWGSTRPPAGVYVLEDEDTQNYNAYDDAAEDVAGYDGPNLGPVNEDEDGEQLSNHVRYGPITVDFVGDTKSSTGSFNMEENVLVPTGTLDYPVEIETTAILGPIPIGGGSDLGGTTITDVDRLEPSTVAE
jgi:hypothetical protein